MPVITLNVNNPTMGYCEGAGTYDYGQTVTIRARAYQDTSTGQPYNFAGWSDGVSETDREIVVVGDATYTANFTSSNIYSVFIEYDSAGGAVTGTGNYIDGTVVTVTATPNSGYEFKGWYEYADQLNLLARTETYSFPINHTMRLRAEFAIPVTTHDIRVISNQPTMGSVTFSGYYNSSTVDSDGYTVYNVDEGSQISLVARANTGYRFVQWEEGQTILTVSPYTFIVTSDRSLAATFEISPIIPVETLLVTVNRTSDGIAGIITDTLDGTVTGSILNKPTPDPFTYQFYWSTDTFDVINDVSSPTVISWTPTISGSNFTLPVGDGFENQLANAGSGNFYLGVVATSSEEIKYQNNILFALEVSDDYHPTIALANSGNLTLGNTYEQTEGGSSIFHAIAGYTTYGITYSTAESPVNNSATITSVVAQPNIGSLAASTGQLLGGTFASSDANYNFVINLSATDTRGRVGTAATNTLEVLGYHMPYFTLVSIEHCDANGVVQQDETLNKYIHIIFTLTIALTSIANTVQPADIKLILNSVTYTNKVTYSESQYSAIIGGALNPTANYTVAVQLEDTVMKQLELSPEIFTASLSTKFPLSLLDDKAGKVGAALGIEATQDDTIELALDTSFKNDVLLKGNTTIGGTNRSAQISSYDLIHNAVRAYESDRLNSNNQDGNYALTIRTMTGNEYKALATKDPHTLYFLSSPIPTGV